MKVLLVGGGVTSAITAMCLRKMLPDSILCMWDKARDAGGRMTTSRCIINENCMADIGAQYITTTDDFIRANADIYNDLFSAGIIEPLKCRTIGMSRQDDNNFVIPKGFGYLVKHFFTKADLEEAKFSYHVVSVNKNKDKWIAETSNGEKGTFDLVILTMPVPQLFLLKSTAIDSLDNEIIKHLNYVTYSSRYALVLFFSKKLGENWGVKYLDDDPIFRYVAIDNIKRNQVDAMYSVVFHTTVAFGVQHLDSPPSDIQQILLSHAQQIFPCWPDPSSIKCHKWRYSQVTNIFPGAPGCLAISTAPPLIIGGDGFMGSTFDNCIRSSKLICRKVTELLNLN